MSSGDHSEVSHISIAKLTSTTPCILLGVSCMRYFVVANFDSFNCSVVELIVQTWNESFVSVTGRLYELSILDSFISGEESREVHSENTIEKDIERVRSAQQASNGLWDFTI